MKRLTTIFVLLVSMLVIVACEKEIPFKGELAKPKLVLNGSFSADSTWHVKLSHSLSIGDTGLPRPVSNAVIRVKDEAGQVLATLDDSGQGNYSHATEKPEVGKKYFIEAEAVGYTTITADDQAPSPVSISIQDTSRSSFLSDKVFSINMSIDDPATEENFYVIDAHSFWYDENGDLVETSPLWIYSLDVNLDHDGIGEDNASYERLYFRDDKFQGQSYPFNVMVSSSWMEYLLMDPYYGVTDVEIVVRVRNASKSLYQYLRSYDKYLNYSFDPTFSQPVQVYSNVKNGFGAFAGYSETRWSFHL